MERKASHKVPDGKMVNIKLEEEDGTVYEVEIRGDFFIEPPEKLHDLEEKLEGVDVSSEKKELIEKIEDINADLVGFSHEDVAEAFRKAVEGDDE